MPGEPEEITFVKHFLDVYMYARHTGDVESFPKLGTEKCESCISGANWIAKRYKAGGYVQGGDCERRESQALPKLSRIPQSVCILEIASPQSLIEGCPAGARPGCDLLIFDVYLVEEMTYG